MSGQWSLVAVDGDAETKLSVAKETSLLHSYVRVTVEWDVPADQPAGTYRITHAGAYRKAKLLGKDEVIKYSGTSRNFTVAALAVASA